MVNQEIFLIRRINIFLTFPTNICNFFALCVCDLCWCRARHIFSLRNAVRRSNFPFLDSDWFEFDDVAQINLPPTDFGELLPHQQDDQDMGNVMPENFLI